MSPLYHLSLLLQHEDLTRRLVIRANEEPLASLIPSEASETPARAHGEGGGVAGSGALGSDDVLVPGLAVRGGDGLVVSVGALLERHLGHEVPLRRLSVPAAVEGYVQVLAGGVEHVGDGRHVCRER